MLMMVQLIALCIEDLIAKLGKKPHLIYMSPVGTVLTQEKVKRLAQLENIAILCGHYEGVDERVLEEFVDLQISIGDYVLTGGELPGLVMADAGLPDAPAFWRRISALKRRAIITAFWSILIILAPLIGGEKKLRKCCSMATMLKSTLGGGRSDTNSQASARSAGNCPVNSTGFLAFLERMEERFRYLETS